MQSLLNLPFCNLLADDVAECVKLTTHMHVTDKLMCKITVTAVYTGELGTGHFLRYKRKSALTGYFYFKIRFWGFKNLRYKRKSGLSDYGLSGGHCT